MSIDVLDRPQLDHEVERRAQYRTSPNGIDQWDGWYEIRREGWYTQPLGHRYVQARIWIDGAWRTSPVAYDP